ncbi:MAG: lysophospholipid acyltransferase family protein [Prolixibacteraceae bacterium]|nr:lysophospholipid acyltransferase family protein [Prolixibacteraceae bacterium]
MRKLKSKTDILKNKSNIVKKNEYFERILVRMLRFNTLSKISGQIAGKQGVEFINEVLLILDYQIEADVKELSRIPKSGPVIVVSNHIIGGLEELLLIKYISHTRNDVKVLGSSLIQQISPVSEFILPKNDVVHYFDDHGISKQENHVSNHLKSNGLVCIFPALEGSTISGFNSLTDKIWQHSVIRFIKSAGVPVVPVYFQGKSDLLQQMLVRFNPIPNQNEFYTPLPGKKNRLLKIRFGNPIPVELQEKFTDIYQFGRFLRARTYCMDSGLEVKRFFNYRLMPLNKPKDIIDPVPIKNILAELEQIREDFTLFNLKNYTVFCAPSNKIPNTLNEIGRLREITFREVGEGTNQSIDVDEFDLYYNQMFIWDNDENKLVGAYRIGLGKEIMAQYGKRGFYLHSLFRLQNEFNPILNESLELGRSFVVHEYQRKPLPLFLLWKGILYFLLKNPEYRYLIGPVSISNNYSEISKEVIIKFILKNHLNWKLARAIKPRNQYKVKSENQNINTILETLRNDINSLDQAIGDIDALNRGIPVLLKKYINLNAKIIGFNVDPKFNNSLDGLIILDVFDIPATTIESLSKDVNDGSILERFYSNRE